MSFTYMEINDRLDLFLPFYFVCFILFLLFHFHFLLLIFPFLLVVE